MRVLFYDRLQEATGAPVELISSPLADVWEDSSATVSWAAPVVIDSVGIGNTDATQITLQLEATTAGGELASIEGEAAKLSGPYAEGAGAVLSGPPVPDFETIHISGGDPLENGLYLLSRSYSSTVATISHNGTYLGRIGLGSAVQLGASPQAEPELWSTADPRVTLSGQIVPGAGGITGRAQRADVRYKITDTKFDEIEAGYKTATGKGYPVFVLFDDEAKRFPWLRMYATLQGEMVFQSSLMSKQLFSKQFIFREAF